MIDTESTYHIGIRGTTYSTIGQKQRFARLAA